MNRRNNKTMVVRKENFAPKVKLRVGERLRTSDTVEKKRKVGIVDVDVDHGIV